MSTANNYGTVEEAKPHTHDHHDHDHEGHAHVHVHLDRLHDSEGFPKESSVWSGLPTWVLLVVEYLIGLAVVECLAFAIALFWVVAAVYHYNVGGQRWLQHVLAIVGFVLACIISPFVYSILALIGFVLWVIWIIKDITAVVSHTPRPKIIVPYFNGLFTYAN